MKSHAKRIRLPALTATLALALLFAPGFAGAEAATDAAATPAAAATASTTDRQPTPLARIAASEDLQRAALARLEQAGRWRELAQRIAALEAQFAALAATHGGHRRADRCRSPGLAGCGCCMATCRPIVDELGSIARQLEHDRHRARFRRPQWRERLSLLEGQRVPAPILERARSMEASLQGASARVRETQDDVLLALDRARGAAGAHRRRARPRRGAGGAHSRATQAIGAVLAVAARAPRPRISIASPPKLRTAWRLLEIVLRARRNVPGRIVLRRPGTERAGSSSAGPGRTPDPRSAPTADRSPHRCSSR